MRRFTGGLGGLVILSALVLPLWTVIANAHVNHWVGGQGEGAWTEFVSPWGGHAWTAIFIFAAQSFHTVPEKEAPLKR